MRQRKGPGTQRKYNMARLSDDVFRLLEEEGMGRWGESTAVALERILREYKWMKYGRK